MSENVVTIYRIIDSQPSDSEVQLIEQFTKDNDLIESNTYSEGDFHCYSLGFYNADISELKDLLVELNKIDQVTTVTKYWFEQTGEDVFFLLVNN